MTMKQCCTANEVGNIPIAVQKISDQSVFKYSIIAFLSLLVKLSPK
jgi:hypothetical protein